MVEVSKCNCGGGDVQEGVEFMCVHVHLRVFFVVISPVSLEHTC